MKDQTTSTPGTLALMTLIAGCSVGPIPAETAAREHLARVEARYRSGDSRPALPLLSGESALDDYLRFSLLNSPKVEAAYHEWAASIERITVARSLPDPRLTFESDIADVLLTVMPGLMLDLPGPGKLRAAGDAAAAESGSRYFAFEAEILRVAFAVKSAYYRLHFLEDNLRVEREMLRLLGDLEQLAQQQNAAGRATLQDVLRAQIERDRIETQIANLEDSRSPLLAELKSALGLGPADADPPAPVRFTPSPAAPDRDGILAEALARNPRIRQMAAEVERAESLLALARKAGVPDFSLGLEADFKASPVVWRPQASMTLPIWRSKIAAQIAAAQAQKRSAEARLTGEQVELAAELAAMLYLYRESLRNADLLESRLVPRGRQSLEAARAGYTTGRSSFLDLIDAQRQLLEFELSLVEARTQRELALASLSLLIAGVPPSGSPALDPEERSEPPSAEGTSP